MARTRKTTPLWARMLGDRSHLATEHHDHRAGPCDLPDHPTNDEFTCPTTRCYWEPSTRAMTGRDSGCPCTMCHNGPGHRRDRRRSRHAARAETHRLGELDPSVLDGE